MIPGGRSLNMGSKVDDPWLTIPGGRTLSGGQSLLDDSWRTNPDWRYVVDDLSLTIPGWRSLIDAPRWTIPGWWSLVEDPWLRGPRWTNLDWQSQHDWWFLGDDLRLKIPAWLYCMYINARKNKEISEIKIITVYNHCYSSFVLICKEKKIGLVYESWKTRSLSRKFENLVHKLLPVSCEFYENPITKNIKN